MANRDEEKPAEINLQELKRELPYKWKPQTCGQYSAIMVGYIDARDVQDLLDEVCQPQNWQCEFYALKDRIFCKIGILLNGQWVWKSDCGHESHIEKEKGEASDAFKRAAVHWGIGRFLYTLPELRLRTAQHKGKWYPAIDGKIIRDKERLSVICSELVKVKTSGGRIIAEDGEPLDAEPIESSTPKPAATKATESEKASPMATDKVMATAQKLREGLLMLTNGDRIKAKAKLTELSRFLGKDGKTIEWTKDIDTLAREHPKWLYRIWGDVEKLLKKQGGGDLPANMADDDEAPPQEEEPDTPEEAEDEEISF
jgi:hypothetical protein